MRAFSVVDAKPCCLRFAAASAVKSQKNSFQDDWFVGFAGGTMKINAGSPYPGRRRW